MADTGNNRKSRMFRHLLFGLLSVVGISTVAYVLGTQAGGLISSFQTEKNKLQTEKQRKLVLEKLESLQPGLKLPNYYFYDLKGNEVELYKIDLSGNCLISYIAIDCGSCIEELETLSKLLKRGEPQTKVILISFSNPFELAKLNEEFDFDLLILYDHSGFYATSENLNPLPFNIFVNRNFEIIEVYPGKLSELEMREVVDIKLQSE